LIKRTLLLEQLSPRQLMAADASVAWQEISSQPLIGQTIDVSLTFDNKGDAPGYGPYVDLVVPDKGLDFVSSSVSILGSSLRETVVIFNSEGKANHPFAVAANGRPIVLTGNPKDKLVVIELPFGSFTPDQPSMQINLQLSVDKNADFGQSVQVVAASGYRYGADALDNASRDPMIRSKDAGMPIVPSLTSTRIEYLGQENETATGENYVRSYRVSLDIAEDATINELNLVSQFDVNQVFRGVRESSFANSNLAFQSDPKDQIGKFASQLVLQANTIKGIDGMDGSFIVDFVVPKYDSSNALVADVLSGSDGLSRFVVSGTGGFVRTASTKDREAEIINFQPVPAVHVLQNELLAVQQSVRLAVDSNAASLGPGDTVEYTIAFQVSDYAVLDDTTIQFTVPDGQIFNRDGGVSLTVNGLQPAAGVLKPWAVTPENVSLNEFGAQTYVVRVADELGNVGLNGRFYGAATSKGQGVAVTGTLTYRAVLQDSFSGTVPSGDVSIDEGDLFQSTVTATAWMVDQETDLATKFVTSDDSGTRNVLKTSPVQTSVYAINGKTSPSSVAVTAGDLVTFRVNRQVRSGDVENLELSSYFPMPVFSINGLQWASGKESLPGENQIQFGAKDTFRALLIGQPKLSVDAANNRLSVSFGDVDSNVNATCDIELLVTVRVQDQPFADGMWLTELANTRQESSNNGGTSSNAVASLQYTRPVLTIVKSAVGSDNPNAQLVNATKGTDIRNVDAGDIVRFETEIQNTGLGRYGAFDVIAQDAIPTGFRIPATGMKLQIVDGYGKSMDYFGNESSLFAEGIQLTNPVPSSAIDPLASRVFVRYELIVSDTVIANTSSASSAKIANYSAFKGGKNYVTSTISDDARITSANAVLQHVRLDTDQPHTVGGNVVIGETVTLKATVQIPEGSMSDALLTINAPQGFAIKSVISALASADIVFEKAIPTNLESITVIDSTTTDPRNGGNRLQLKLGSMANKNLDNRKIETIEVIYTATVTNDLVNVAGKSLSNSAVWTHGNGRSAINSNSVTINEPKLSINKLWSKSQADAGDRVTVTLDIVPSKSMTTTAFDVALSEQLPSGATYVAGSLRWVSGPAPSNLMLKDGLVSANWIQFANSTSGRLQYEVIVGDEAAAGSKLTNNATITWTSLAGAPGQIAKTNLLSFERTGNPSDVGGISNTYQASLQSSLTIAPVQVQMKLIDSSHQHTTGSNLTIGERAIYEVLLTIPEGKHTLVLEGLNVGNDALLTLESLSIVSVGSNLTVERGRVGTEVKASADGRLSLDFGFVHNRADNLATTSDTIVLRLIALVGNSPVNQAGDSAITGVKVDYQFGTASNKDVVRLVEPQLRLQQKVNMQNVDAGDVVEAEIRVVRQDNITLSAFELNLADSLSNIGLNLMAGSVSVNNGRIVAGNNPGDAIVKIEVDELNSVSELVVNYKAQVSRSAIPGSTLSLNPSLFYRSVAGMEGRTYNTAATTNLFVNSTKLTGTVFVDANQNGLEEFGDQGIGGVTVTLFGVDHLGNQVSRTTQSLPTGYYEFDSLRPGSYGLIEIQPDTYSDGADFVGALGGDVGHDRFDNILIAKGSSGTVDGYRFTESPLTWIEGTVFVDESEDAILGADEEGIANIIIKLVGVTGTGQTIQRTTATNSRGYYVFGYLEAGTYSITEGKTDGFFDSKEQLGTVGGDVANDVFDNVTVASGKPGKMYNFGEYQPGSITGRVYIDYDRDANLDRKDGLLAGVQVRLSGVNDLGEKIESTTTTESDGTYRFDGLRPGTYRWDSDSLEGLESSVSNVGHFLRGFKPNLAQGAGIKNGFENVRLGAGARAVNFNIGHVDPLFLPSIKESKFTSQISFNGTNGNDLFDVSFTTTGATIVVNGKEFTLDASETRSIRLLGSFGQDTLKFTGSEFKEEIDLRERSARITGTWFEALPYGMETVQFVGGGNEDLARFYDTKGDDRFVAEPFNATMSGSGYINKVEGVHRIYAYMTEGFDTVSMIGKTGWADDFTATPSEAKLYDGEFYLYARNFDTVSGKATDDTDRAYLYGSIADDFLTANQSNTTFKGNGFSLSANEYFYVNVSAKEGGNDSAALTGSSGNDSLSSRPIEATFDMGIRRVFVQAFDKVEVMASSGNDTAYVYDSHYNDTFIADALRATIKNSINETSMINFDRVYAYMDAGGEDIATLRGSDSIDTFKASPTQWTMEGGGIYLLGTGFTSVTAYGTSSDIAYLYDSAFDDILDLTVGSAMMQGLRYANKVAGFGKINAEATQGNDRVVFRDNEVRSTIRFNETKTSIFGTGYSYNATGFDSVDAFYSSLNGLDNVELDGRIDYDLRAVDIAGAKFKLSLQVNEKSKRTLLKANVKDLLLKK
jgi:hypothetical protein